VSLGVGQQAVITNPSDFCLQFDQSSSSERYLVGVQSLSATVDALTTVSLVAEAADGSGAANVEAPALTQRTRTSGAGAVSPTFEQSGGQWRAEMRLRDWERAHLDPSQSLPALRSAGSGPRVLLSVSGSANVGDTVALRVPDYAASDPCSTYSSVTATVQAIGTRAIIVADTANPANGFTQADYQDLSDRLDNTIFATDVAYFGDPGDLDGNGHIVVVFSKELNAMSTGVSGTTLLGFVFPGDLYPRSSTTGLYCPSSDEGEIYYGRVPDPNGLYGTSSTRTDELQRAPTIMAHELVHLIQVGRRFAASHDWMDPSMAEGQAVLGQEVVGHAATGRVPYQNYGYDVALNTSGIDQFDWYAEAVQDLFFYFGWDPSSSASIAGAPEQCGWWQRQPTPCVSRSLWYGVGWSFLRWLSDRYGPAYPGGEQGLQQALIADTATGPQMAADVVGVPLETLMAEWSAALYVDDRISNPDPSLTFTSWNLFDFEQNTVATKHLTPLEAPFADWQASGDIRSSSAGYLAVDGTSRPATALKVRDASGNLLSSYMQVWVVRLR